jgi:CHAT domain/Tetratricopeptide repeat
MRERDQWMQAVLARLDRVATNEDLSPVLEEAALTEARELTRTLTDELDSLPTRHLLGWLHWYRFQALPEGLDQQDLQDAVAMLIPCFLSGMSDLPVPLLPLLADQATQTAMHLLEMAQRSVDEELLSAATRLWDRILTATPDDHPDRAGRLSNLGNALRTRFERNGTRADIDGAIQAVQQAVQATPDGHPDRAMFLTNLGNALLTRFLHTGARADVDNAIQATQQAVQATPADHPDRARRLSNLGTALATRFERTGAQADLDDAIHAGQQAVQATPADHPDRAAIMSNLGTALLTRYGRTGAQADLDNAIHAGQQAVQATPDDHPNLATYLSNLGTALFARYELTGAQADLDDAIHAGQQAVQATPDDHLNLAGQLSNLGTALATRFVRNETHADIDSAIHSLQQAVQATPADHPHRAIYLSNLGNALRTRFERTGTAVDLDAASQMFNEAAGIEVAAASVRIDAGRAGASLMAETNPGRAASLLEAAVLLLPEVAPRFLDRGDQQYAIGRFAGLAANAAALALSDPAVPEPQRPARGLRLLEAARAVLLSQALSTRGDLSELQDHHPELALRFTELRGWLDRPPRVTGPDMGNLPGDETADALQHAIRDRRHAAAELAQLLARIRGLEGFATFGLPPSAEELEAQAQQGPVVVLNVSAYRSDAILLTSDSITSQPLPGLAQASVIEQISVFYQALDVVAASESPLARVRAQEEIRRVLGWLWDNAAGPVLHALGYRDQPADGEPWPRLWWVPGGLLALLPLHAAGHHTSPPDPAHRTVMDRVISSYTPTIGALAHARTPRPDTANRSLIVAMPTTPDLPRGAELAYVPAEAALLQARLPNPTALTEPAATCGTADEQLPTKSAVLEQLPGCAIAHFACHGYTDPADPSQSRLLLHDHRQDPLTVAALAPVVLDHAQLAYLSACSTARLTDPRLLDEAIHLTTAFQLAGFPHVIGTLWEINDAIAVEIASTFYAALTDPGGTLNPARAARALHQATRAQRNRQPANPYLWASHIHAGA